MEEQGKPLVASRPVRMLLSVAVLGVALLSIYYTLGVRQPQPAPTDDAAPADDAPPADGDDAATNAQPNSPDDAADEEPADAE